MADHAAARTSGSTEKSLAIPLGAFAGGAVVAVLLGVFGRVHDPTLTGTTDLGFRTVLEMKVAVSLVIGVLVVLQLLSALWLYGRIGGRPPSWLGTAHRISGTLTVLLAVFVGYSCLWALGLEVGTLHNGEEVPLRAVVHGVLGCAVFGAVVAKVAAVRARRAPGWFLPVAGGLLFTLLLVVVLSSAAWWIGAHGWPSPGGY